MKTQLYSSNRARKAGTHLAKLGLALIAAGVATSCTTTKPSPASGSQAYFNYDRPANRPSNPANVRVKVSLAKQLTYVMEGNRPLLVMPVSVGTSSTPTPTGSFRIQNKDHYHRANTHGYAYNGSQARQTYLRKKPAGWSFKGTPMPYWCGFIGESYGFHTGWMKHAPCTHGCIRMHENVAPKFFNLVRIGTPVSIARSQPEDAHSAPTSAPPDATPLPDYPAQYMLGTATSPNTRNPSSIEARSPPPHALNFSSTGQGPAPAGFFCCPNRSKLRGFSVHVTKK